MPLTKIEASRWPVVGAVLRWYHVIFINRGAVDRAALQATWEVLDRGISAVISPEGTRSADGGLQAAKEGLAFIARHNPECWLMPCAVTGTPAFTFTAEAILAPAADQLTYGRPFRFRWPEGKASRDVLREMTDEAMLQIAAVLPPEMRGGLRRLRPGAVHWLQFLDEANSGSSASRISGPAFRHSIARLRIERRWTQQKKRWGEQRLGPARLAGMTRWRFLTAR